MIRRTIHRALACSILTVGTLVWGADPPVAPGLITPAPVAPAGTNAIGPKIQFQTPVYDFGRAQSGEQVKYTYILTNGGDQTLEISGVQACGCITANWTRSVEPGKTGSIPISFNSTGYGGPVGKTVTVTCNDKANPRPMLQFKGTVWKPLDVVPPMGVLNLSADSPLASVTVRVTNNLPEPITVSAPESNNRAFAAELKTIQAGKEFEVIIAPVSPLPPGNAQAQFTLKTSSTNAPVITIPVFANVQPAITLSPVQVQLPAPPLAQSQTVSLDVMNHSTNLIVLFEPTVNAPGVDVQLKEVTPGKRFSAALTFPQGFEISQGQRVELSIKTSLPLMPVLKAPIMQPLRPPPPRIQPPAPAQQVKRPSVTSTNKHRPLPPVEMPPLPP
jgi:hypothetical protein